MSTGSYIPNGAGGYIYQSQLGQAPMASYIFTDNATPPNSGSSGPTMGQLGYAAMGQANSLNASGNAAVNAARGGANQAANATANQLRSLGSAMSGEFSYNDAYARQALEEAFDPHQDIYNRYLGQVTDQTNSQSALRGIANTPYGAAVTADSLGNFNIGWEAQKIQNENIGMQTATGLQQQRLSAQEAGGALINQAGQLNLGAAKNLLEAYGIQGADMSAALSALTNMFGAQVNANSSYNSTVSKGGGGIGQTPGEAGGYGSGGFGKGGSTFGFNTGW